MTPEEKAERERELTRQRVQRYRDKQREESQNDDFQAQNVTLHVTDVTENGNARVTPGVTGNANVTPEGARFQLKMPFAKEPEKVKLFTNKEAEEELEKLTFIYTKGSQLLDEVLEIVVKGHEKVQIWELSDGEAQMLADMHLDKAKQDQGAARSARALLSLYDRMYTIMLIGPRVMATGRHVKEHGGLSFK